MRLLTDFTKFLEEYGVIGLAVAFVMGLAVKDLVTSIVDNLIMPIVGVLLPSGNWQNAVWEIAGISFGIGQLLSALIDFVLIAMLVFIFVKYALGKEEVEKI